MELEGFPMVRDADENLWYGGTQDWYKKKFSRLTGCGATCAANLAAFYKLGITPDLGQCRNCPLYSSEQYLALMDSTLPYIKPGLRGFPWRNKFQEKFCSFAKDHGISFTTDYLEGWSEIQTPLKFIKAEFDAGRPLALLILHHENEDLLADESWHWMTISGYDADAGKIIISSFGRKKALDVNLVFKPGKKNDVHLLSFRKVNSEAAVAV